MSAWQLNESQIATIIPKLQGQTTEQLLQIWNKEVLNEYRSEESLEAVKRVLAQRGTTPPTRLQVWLRTNAVPLLIFGGAGMILLLKIQIDLLQDQPVGFPSIFALVGLAAFAWAWLTQSQKIRDLLATEPEPAQIILRKQLRAYRVIIALLPLWGLALIKLGPEARFALFGAETSIFHLFGFLFLLPMSYIGASAIKHQILLYYPKGGGPRVARGNSARAWGALLLCLYVAFWLISLFTQPRH